MEIFKNVIQFFQEVKDEFSKVVWLTKLELMGATVIVLLLVAFFALYVGFLDYIINSLITYIFSMVRV